MEKFCIDVNGAKVRYISDIPLLNYFLNNKKFMEFYNAQIIEDSPDINHTIIYRDVDNEQSLIVDNNKMIINYPKEKLTESIILYMGFHYLEKQFGEKGMCSCHSACISKNGEATLLIGEAGSGKTSLAVNLCNDYGYSLVSNDMTLIGSENDEIYVYGGTKFLNLRYLSVESNMPFLKYLFDNQNKDSWTNKISVMASDIGIDEEYETLPIKNILFIHVDNRAEFKVSNGDSWRNNFLLYQNTSSHIRGSAATFIDNRGYPIAYIPPFETKETYDKRKKLLNLINENQNYYYVSGSLNDVINFINKLNNVETKDKQKVLERSK